MLSNYTYSKYAINKGYNDDIKLIAPYYFELISTPRELERGYWEFEDCKVKVQSHYFDFVSTPPPPLENYGKKVYVNEKPFNNVDNKYYFVVWRGDKGHDGRIIKFKNNTSDRKTIDIFKNATLKKRNGIPFGQTLCIEGSIRVISGEEDDSNHYFKSVYRGDGNSEPDKPFISPATGAITNGRLKEQEINDYIYKIDIKNKDISENHVYKLEANYFNGLSITNELETNNIPSLIPAEIKLSDGEYGKYLTNLVIYNDKIEEYLNYFSRENNKLIYSKQFGTKIISYLAKDSIKIIFKEDEKISILDKIEISGIGGYGNYDISIFFENPNEKIIRGKDITLELIQNLPVGSKIFTSENKNDYFFLGEYEKGYFKHNGTTKNPESSSEIANFLKLFEDKVFIIKDPDSSKKININSIQLFNKNNEKLSSITLEI